LTNNYSGEMRGVEVVGGGVGGEGGTDMGGVWVVKRVRWEGEMRGGGAGRAGG